MIEKTKQSVSDFTEARLHPHIPIIQSEESEEPSSRRPVKLPLNCRPTSTSTKLNCLSPPAVATSISMPDCLISSSSCNLILATSARLVCSS